MADCLCSSLADLAHIPMGDHERRDEQFLATLDIVREAGDPQWWLYLGRCHLCGQHWLVAQEEQIYDEHLLARLAPSQTNDIRTIGHWPDIFTTYEAVLTVARQLSHPGFFMEAMADPLICTVEDLRRERPEISGEEMARLLGVSQGHMRKLLAKTASRPVEHRLKRLLSWLGVG